MTKDEIDWSHVAPEYKWMARDKDSRFAYLYGTEPYLETSWWEDDLAGCSASVSGFASYKRGTCDWRESLVRRPE